MLTITAGHLLSTAEAGRTLRRSRVDCRSLRALTLVAQWASLPGWLMATAAMVALTTWGVVGLASDAQAGIAFIFIIPLEVFVVAAAGWRLLKPR